MTTMQIDRATVEQALEALEYENSWHESFKVRPYASTIDAVAALRAALAQQAEPVQEPAFHGFMSDDGTQVDVCFSPSAPRKDGTYATAYYTAPPQREQVLLTNEEIDALPWNGSPRQFARVVQKAFLEKNK